MDTAVLRVICLVIIFVIAAVCGTIPLVIMKVSGRQLSLKKYGKISLDMISCFSGGVFFGTCLIHLFMEGFEEFERYKQEMGFKSKFPIYETLVAVGTLLVAVVDTVGGMIMNRKFHTVMKRKQRVKGMDLSQDGSVTLPGKEQHGLRIVPHTESQPVPTAEPQDSVEIRSLTSALLLLLAISFHAIFDGLAIGLQDTESDIWQVMTAVSIHKGVVAFCLGWEFAQTNIGQAIMKGIIYMLVFSVVTPVGLIVAIAVTSSNLNVHAQLLASSLLQALATGTFLYVTFFEILGRHLGHHHPTVRGEESEAEYGRCVELMKIPAIALGFGVMAAAKLLEGEED